ncbi:DUF262 domain-containing protein [Dactylosporangium sp. NPDC049140]|uniref:GmrSD restriction endonuclease domain-containing protein n=1 Tax=Dactylosporangium sp. NPDC049140 TaxID=3155647 RepID=UPI0033CC794B
MGAITPHYRTVAQLLQSRTFSVDDYQREYKWDTSNIEELLSDLLGRFQNAYRDGDEPSAVAGYPTYFLGSIIVTRRGNVDFLVDGQQRVTSLTLLLIYLYREAKRCGYPVAATIESLIFSDNYGQPNFNLKITDRLPAIRALFHGEDFTADGRDESTQAIIRRYQDIHESGVIEELSTTVPNFIYWFINSVGLIEIVADTDADAYAIFETMNDRGKPLSPVDMLKAYLLAPIEDQDQRAAANQTWRRTVRTLTSWEPDPNPERDAVFIKTWLRAQYSETIRDRKAGATDKDWELIGTTFHRWIRDQATRLRVGDAKSNFLLMTEEFPFFARAYEQILEAGRRYTPGLEAVFYNTHNDFTWQSTVLLAPLAVGDDDTTVRRKMGVTATYLDIWLMRRVVNYIRVSYSNVSYTMWMLCRDIRNKPLDDLIDTLRDRLADDEATFEGNPSRNRDGISGLVLNQFTRRYIFHLLARLTAYVEAGSGRADQFPHYVDRTVKNPQDIEHIWAADYAPHAHAFPDEDDFWYYRGHVGALVLLPADVNRSYQDLPFAAKAPHYAKQNLYAASLTNAAYKHQPQFRAFAKREELPFRPFDSFDLSAVQERIQLVHALAKKIWSPDRLEEFRG